MLGSVETTPQTEVQGSTPMSHRNCFHKLLVRNGRPPFRLPAIKRAFASIAGCPMYRGCHSFLDCECKKTTENAQENVLLQHQRQTLRVLFNSHPFRYLLAIALAVSVYESPYSPFLSAIACRGHLASLPRIQERIYVPTTHL
jgi:hypothetical protein